MYIWWHQAGAPGSLVGLKDLNNKSCFCRSPSMVMDTLSFNSAQISPLYRRIAINSKAIHSVQTQVTHTHTSLACLKWGLYGQYQSYFYRKNVSLIRLSKDAVTPSHLPQFRLLAWRISSVFIPSILTLHPNDTSHWDCIVFRFHFWTVFLSFCSLDWDVLVFYRMRETKD